MTAKPSHIDNPRAFSDAFDVSRETISRLERYEALLKQWQKAVNLVAPDTLDDVWERHFADSAQLVLAAETAEKWLDLGTGGGFPGMVVAILLANRSDSSVHLIDSNARKCAFLSEVARETGTKVTIQQARIEDVSPDTLDMRPDIVTARALTALDNLLGLALPFFGDDTRGLFLKGRTASHEVDDARKRYSFDARMIPSYTSKEGCIVEISNLQHTGKT